MNSRLAKTIQQDTISKNKIKSDFKIIKVRLALGQDRCCQTSFFLRKGRRKREENGPREYTGTHMDDLPRTSPCAMVKLGNRHISYSQEAGGATVSKQVKRSRQDLHQEGIWHLEFLSFLTQSVVGSTFSI